MTYGLLPSGFPDRKAPEAERLLEAGYRLARFFIDRGYAFHSPPLLEFADTLRASFAGIEMRDMFRMTDPESLETLVLRSDVTAQIVRMAQRDVALGHAALPLRVSYMGPMVRVAAEEPGGLRQRTQAGIEYIGAPLGEALEEVAGLLAGALAELGVADVVLAVGLPGLVRAIEAMLAPDEEGRAAFRRALSYKDREYVRRHVSPKTGVDAEWLLGMKADAGGLPEGLASYAAPAERLRAALEAAFPRLSCRIDPADVHHFPYHKDVVFAAFCRATGKELARGGHYMIGERHAVGATLYAEDVCSRILYD
jgi:ATP phosphoribosyltransferase regulatory subunit